MQHGNKTRGTGPLGGAGMVGLWGASSLIESIQRGTITYDTSSVSSATATIAAVDMSRSRLRFNGLYISGGANNNKLASRIAFTNATTITVTVTGGGGAGLLCIVSYEVIQYMPGVVRNIQRGTALGNTVWTITEVRMDKSEVDYLGAQGSDINTNITTSARVLLSTTTGVNNASVGLTNDTVGMQVTEFF